VLTAFILLLTSTEVSAQEAAHTVEAATPRFRFGVSVGVGVGSVKTDAGEGLAASLRAGVQITRVVAVSYQVTAAGTIYGFPTGKSDSWTSHALLVEYMAPGRMFSIGGGPSIVSGSTSWTNNEANMSSSSPYLGLGFDGRAAYTFGANLPEFRCGFTVELAVHVSPQDYAVVPGIGFDLF
jgi:hypothetical protein